MRYSFFVAVISVVALHACARERTVAPAEGADATPRAKQISTAPSAATPSKHTATDAYDEIVAASDRDPADRALDAGRHPAELLRFFGIAPGMKVAEISAGGGYTAELLARAVGESGRVYGVNSKVILERFAEEPWTTRLAKPVMKNVVRVDREFESPLPPDAKGLDAVLMVLFYHDTVWMKTDRQRMNRAIFAALRSGGLYGVVDHSSRPGAGTSEAETLHRIEETVVRDEITRAGFVLRAEGDFLRSPSDKRDWNASPRKAGELRGTSDRFVLRFAKP